MDSRLVLLAPGDNCVVVAQPLAAGSIVEIDGAQLPVRAAIATGHKLARRPLAAGATVFKYGAAIGHATRQVAMGEHLHTHNVASDYIATVLAPVREAEA